MSKGMDMINEVNDKLYDEKMTEEEKNTKLKNYFNKRTTISSEKIRLERERRLIENLNQSFIKDSLAFDIPIDMILDNATLHTANATLEAFKILNITPIFLPARSPDLSPIEDIWRIIKDTLARRSHTVLIDLVTDFKEEFYKLVQKESFYEDWLNKWFKHL